MAFDYFKFLDILRRQAALSDGLIGDEEIAAASRAANAPEEDEEEDT